MIQKMSFRQKMRTESLEFPRFNLFMNNMIRQVKFVVPILLCMTVLACSGCSRQHYRVKADKEVYSLLEAGGTKDCRWQLSDYRIEVDPRSRMYDRNNPDNEPMPPDDASAHVKMHRVDGKKGSKHWHEHGNTKHVENPCWRQYLLYNERGAVPLDINGAMDLALLHSPEYQSALEDLYLSAAKVSQERFRFDVQFYGGESLFYTAAGRLRDNGTFLNNNIDIEAQKLFATGGELVVGLANSITWTFSGKNDWYGESLFNVGLVQPLLRNAGRKVVLENLTQSERDFLAAIRNMVFFQQQFYTKVVTGYGSGGYYDLLKRQIQIRNLRQNIIGLEENLQRFQALKDSNLIDDVYQVEDVRQSVLSSESRLLTQVANYEGYVETYIRALGLPPDLKVEIADPVIDRFQLTSPTITPLQEDISYLFSRVRRVGETFSDDIADKLDDFVQRTKSEIVILENDLVELEKSVPERIAGLKALESQLAEQIRLGERIEPVIYDSNEFLKRIGKLRDVEIPNNIRKLEACFVLLQMIIDHDEPTLRKMIEEDRFSDEARQAMEILRLGAIVDFERPRELIEKLDEMEKTLKMRDALQELLEKEKTDMTLDPAPLVPKAPRKNAVETDIASTEPEKTGETISIRVDASEIEEDYNNPDPKKVIPELKEQNLYREWVRNVLTEFQNEVASLSIMQIRTRVDSITLVPTMISQEEAFRIAEENRLDWMNRRARLVDSWRQIDIAANKLKGELNVRVEGEIGTVDKKGVRFDADNGRLRVGLEWDSPLTRHNEMLDYRRAQIDYQAARRDYYTYVDGVQAEIRNTLRNTRLRQIDFEIQRNAVFIAAIKVDVAQLEMIKPVERNSSIDTNTSQRLINSLDGMASTQNDFMSGWLDYQTLRMTLDLNMGTMQLDSQGRWVDPGEITRDRLGPVAKYGGRNAVPSLIPSKRKHGKQARQVRQVSMETMASSHPIPPAPRLDDEPNPVLAPEPEFEAPVEEPEQNTPLEPMPEEESRQVNAAPIPEELVPEPIQPKAVHQNSKPKTAQKQAPQSATDPDTLPITPTAEPKRLQPAPAPPKSPE